MIRKRQRQRQRQRQQQRDSNCNCNTRASRTWEAWWCLPARLARAATTTAVQQQQQRKCSCSRTWEARPLLFAIYYLCRSVGSPGGRLGVDGGGCLVRVLPWFLMGPTNTYLLTQLGARSDGRVPTYAGMIERPWLPPSE